jgi:uncharacterized membrane-anchored protein
MKFGTFLIGALVAALLQTAALGKIVWDRVSLINNGAEVVLKSEMVDPRDLFRGYYVTLNLSVGEVTDKSVEVVGTPATGSPVFIELKKGEDEYWVANRLYAEYPATAEGPVIKGELLSDWPVTGETGKRYVIRFPFDRFFAPAERARKLEDVRRDRNLGVVLAVGEGGEAAIKGISVAGEMIYDEKLF